MRHNIIRRLIPATKLAGPDLIIRVRNRSRIRNSKRVFLNRLKRTPYVQKTEARARVVEPRDVWREGDFFLRALRELPSAGAGAGAGSSVVDVRMAGWDLLWAPVMVGFVEFRGTGYLADCVVEGVDGGRSGPGEFLSYKRSAVSVDGELHTSS